MDTGASQWTIGGASLIRSQLSESFRLAGIRKTSVACAEYARLSLLSLVLCDGA